MAQGPILPYQLTLLEASLKQMAVLSLLLPLPFLPPPLLQTRIWLLWPEVTSLVLLHLNRLLFLPSQHDSSFLWRLAQKSPLPLYSSSGGQLHKPWRKWTLRDGLEMSATLCFPTGYTISSTEQLFLSGHQNGHIPFSPVPLCLMTSWDTPFTTKLPLYMIKEEGKNW